MQGESGSAKERPELNPQVVELGPAVLTRVLEKYIETQSPLIATMKSALASGELQQLQDAAHSLKGSAATLGLATMAALSKEVEMAARSGDLKAAAEALQKVEPEGRDLDIALGVYLDELRAQ